ncbi:MAG: hypothetical protein JST60_18180 [Chloroflexi bacterium SZAS-1]|jgi:cytochrome c-type biogenesis protein CcmH/NrfF|nr:hypothetical protein [Chloroflexi bacterium SZAS-1]
MSLVLLQGAAPVPASGFMLCFIPLAAIVLGLVAFFVYTDRHAARPYLRLNPSDSKQNPVATVKNMAQTMRGKERR